jgi:hypothetical protein
MFRQIEVDDATPLVGQDEQHEEYSVSLVTPVQRLGSLHRLLRDVGTIGRHTLLARPPTDLSLSVLFN